MDKPGISYEYILLDLSGKGKTKFYMHGYTTSNPNILKSILDLAIHIKLSPEEADYINSLLFSDDLDNYTIAEELLKSKIK